MDSSDSLARIEARLARIERALTVVEREVPQAVGFAQDAFDEWASRHPDLDHRLEALVGLLERVTRPETVKTLTALVDQLDTLPDLGATAMDSLDDLAGQGRREGWPLGTAVEEFLATMQSMLRVAPQIRTLLNSGAFEPKTVATLGRLASTLSQASADPKPVGFMGAIRAMSDPEVQRSVGFAVEMARGFGRDEEHLG